MGMRDELTEQHVAFGRQPELNDEDVEYVRSAFRRLSEAERNRAIAGLGPKPAYILPDGTSMVSVAPDEELAAASGVEDLRRRFTKRWQDAGGRPEDVDAELASWLDGRYGVCLPTPCPEMILAKAGIAQAIAALAGRPLPQEDWWRQTLRGVVAAYDALVLPFASVDPERFGRATSRTLLVDQVRERWSDVFTEGSFPSPMQGVSG